MHAAGDRGFEWWLPLSGVLGAAISLLPITIWGNDIAAFLASFVLIVFVAIILLAVAFTKFRRHRLEVLAMACIFVALSFFIFRASGSIRTTTRWLVHSKSYKAKVLSQPAPSDGSLKHIEWDGWGFPGAGDTTVYLVNDPGDLIERSLSRGLSGRFSGIPCEVVRVHRLENHWYTVLFYTDTDWSHCA